MPLKVLAPPLPEATHAEKTWVTGVGWVSSQRLPGSSPRSSPRAAAVGSSARTSTSFGIGVTATATGRFYPSVRGSQGDALLAAKRASEAARQLSVPEKMEREIKKMETMLALPATIIEKAARGHYARAHLSEIVEQARQAKA